MQKRIRPAVAAAAVLAAWILQQGVLEAQTVDAPALEVEVVAPLFNTPTSMAFIAPDDLLVLQKSNGRVRRVTSDVPGAFVLDVNVDSASERGLLGIATDPDFVNNGYVYLFYTETQDVDDGPVLGNRVYRYRWDGGALVEPLLVLDLPVSPERNHNGGIVVFGSDDRLYTLIGDLNHLGKLQNFATGPDPDDTGVILRTDGYGTTLIDNPFFDPADPGNPLGRYFAYGIRNSFGLAVDPVSGELWDTENGPLDMDEINRVEPGFNSGWRTIMGPDDRSSGDQSDLWHAPGSAYSDPEFSWADTIGPTAIQFVASRRLGCELEHTLLVADVDCGQLYRFRLDPSRQSLDFASAELQDLVADNLGDLCAGEQSEIVFGQGFGLVSDIETGPDGFLYVVSIATNTIYRIRPVEPVPGDSDGDLVPDACDCATADPQSYAEPLEVPHLRPSKGPSLRLGWDDQRPVSGPGTTYAIASGSLADLHATGTFAGACALASSVSASATSDPRPDPGPGDGYYYLVRASNGCGAGTYGDSGEAVDPRDLLDASMPPACE